MSSSNQVNIHVVWDPLVMSSVSKDSPPPPDDSFLMSSPLLLLTTMVEPDLSIALCKGIRSTHNPYPYYIAFIYHRLLISAIFQ